jgi:hypothetical protein
MVCDQVEGGGGGGGGARGYGIQNQKQEPHTKMWGTTDLFSLHNLIGGPQDDS